jgi:hypothetical protein
MFRCTRLLVAALFLAAAAPLLAGPAFTFTDPGFVSTNGSWVFGIRFDVTSSVTVTALGYYDQGSDGFLDSHEVGLYTGDGTLLASTTVVSSDPLTGWFRYSAIDPLVLLPGTYEVVGVSHTDLYSYVAQGFSVDPALTYLYDRYDSGTTLHYPVGQVVNDVPNGFWGPNLFLDGGGVVVPEPASAGLILVGLLGLLAYRRRAAAR